MATLRVRRRRREQQSGAEAARCAQRDCRQEGGLRRGAEDQSLDADGFLSGAGRRWCSSAVSGVQL